MIPHKEELVYFENLASRQVRIYEDACDYGIPTKAFNRAEARRNLMTLRRFYKGETKFWGSTQHNSTTRIFIPFEYDEGHEVGTMLEVSYQHDTSRARTYLSISFAPSKRKLN